MIVIAKSHGFGELTPVFQLATLQNGNWKVSILINLFFFIILHTHIGDRIRWFKARALVKRWHEEILLREADFDRIYHGYGRLLEAWKAMGISHMGQPSVRAYCFQVSHYYS